MQSLCNFWRTPQLKIQNQEPSLSIHFSRWFILIPDWSPLGQFIGQLIRSSTDKSVFLNVRLQDHPWSGLSCDVITWFTETCDTCAQINASVTYYCFIDKSACLQIIENQLVAEGLENRLGSLKVKWCNPRVIVRHQTNFHECSEIVSKSLFHLSAGTWLAIGPVHPQLYSPSLYRYTLLNPLQVSTIETLRSSWSKTGQYHL